MVDLNIESGKYARCIKFRAEKIKDKDRLTAVLNYVVNKLRQRFGHIIASDLRIQFFECDADNFVKDLVTARITFDYIVIDKDAQ